MKKSVLLLVVLVYTFTLTACGVNTFSGSDVSRNVINQENDEIDDMSIVYKYISEFQGQMEDIVGYEYGSEDIRSEVETYNELLFQEESLDIQAIKQIDLLDTLNESIEQGMFHFLKSAERPFAENGIDDEEKEVNLPNDEIFFGFVNEDYLYTSLTKDSRESFSQDIHKLVIDNQRYYYESLEVDATSSRYKIEYTITDSKNGFEFVHITYEESSLSFIHMTFDFQSKIMNQTVATIYENKLHTCDIGHFDFKQGIAYEFYTRENEVRTKELTHFIDNAISLLYREELDDNSTLEYSVKDLTGWDYINESGLYNKGEIVYELDLYQEVYSSLSHGVYIEKEIELPLTESSFIKAHTGLEYIQDFSYQDFQRELSNLEDYITQNFKKDSIMLFEENFEGEEAVEEYLFGVIPAEYSDVFAEKIGTSMKEEE